MHNFLKLISYDSIHSHLGKASLTTFSCSQIWFVTGDHEPEVGGTETNQIMFTV